MIASQTEGVIVKVFPKGFGFVSVDGVSDNIFFHLKELSVEFSLFLRGEPVTCDVKERKKGLFATNVKLHNVPYRPPQES